VSEDVVCAAARVAASADAAGVASWDDAAGVTAPGAELLAAPGLLVLGPDEGVVVAVDRVGETDRDALEEDEPLVVQWPAALLPLPLPLPPTPEPR
jgi:hypothetical protein